MFDPVTRTFSPDDPILLQLQGLVAQDNFAAAYAVLADFLLSKNGGQCTIFEASGVSMPRECKQLIMGLS